MTFGLHIVELVLAAVATWLAMDFVGLLDERERSALVTEVTVEASIKILIMATILATIGIVLREAVLGIIEKIGWDSNEWTNKVVRKLGLTVASVVAMLTIGGGSLAFGGGHEVAWNFLPQTFLMLAIVLALQIAIVKSVYDATRPDQKPPGDTEVDVAARRTNDG